MTCPICGSKTVPSYRPFCSKRCADLDLAKWLNGSYAIPASSEDEEEPLDQEAETPVAPRH